MYCTEFRIEKSKDPVVQVNSLWYKYSSKSAHSDAYGGLITDRKITVDSRALDLINTKQQRIAI